MPVYEFVCLDCRKEFDVVKSMNEFNAKSVKCPKCGSKKLDRLWSSVFVETSKKS